MTEEKTAHSWADMAYEAEEVLMALLRNPETSAVQRERIACDIIDRYWGKPRVCGAMDYIAPDLG